METLASSESDAIFFYDEAMQVKFLQEKPWVNDPHFFKRVKVSALALLKMVVHAHSGDTIEVMGLMHGKSDGDAIIIINAFALPVEGTELGLMLRDPTGVNGEGVGLWRGRKTFVLS
ncbi:COP9 signalosome complex subunit 5a [Sarracenia purpurea var. burkii]